jgi:hypothetical protein
MTPLSWWANPALRDDREAFYLRADIEGERIQRAAKQSLAYVTAIGDRADYWKKPKATAYHDEAA